MVYKDIWDMNLPTKKSQYQQWTKMVWELYKLKEQRKGINWYIRQGSMRKQNQYEMYVKSHYKEPAYAMEGADQANQEG